MPRYIRVADVPAILSELQQIGKNSQPYQLDGWQRKWCFFASKPRQDAAVLSYRWRTRGAHENIQDYRTWLEDCRAAGYKVYDLRGPSPAAASVDWALADGHTLQLEVAVWLLWLHGQGKLEYAWLDQMCVPQDANTDEKMSYIRESPAIYTEGQVYLLLAPVVDEDGRIMNRQAAEAIVDQYTDEMDAYDMFRRRWRQQQQHQPDDEDALFRPPPAAGFLRKSAITSLLVNHSYMRRVWTIQEAVAARDLRIWPLQGSGEVKAYQGKLVVDWPDFIAWNSQPQLEALNFAFDDKAVNGYLEGEYGKVISLLRQRPPGSIGHLAMLSKDLMWITMDRNGLVESVRAADGPAGRAYVVLNHHQVMRARSFLPADRVLALVPLVDYAGWREATAGAHSSRLVQASVAWAYDVMEQGRDWRWSIRIYNSPSCSARSLDLLQPRRNLDDGTAVHGRAPGWRLQIPVKGGTFHLTAADPRVTADLSDAAATAANNNNNNNNISAGTEAPPPPTAATAATAAGLSSLELCVLASLLMPHPGFAPNWSDEGGSWDPLRNVLRSQRGDDGFRLAVQWGLEPWRNPGLGFDMERSAVVVVRGEGLTHPALILMALEARGGKGDEAEAEPATAQVMAVVDVRIELLPEVLMQLRAGALRELTEPLKVVSAGVVPAPAAPLKTSAP